ncbi:MAG: hypothetical protein JXA07_07350 [Spirochaetes bacterium]|nr:hypothetical protein [Spirochaetota bacterium]
MNRNLIAALAAALCISSVSFLSCSDSESRHLARLGQARVIIDLGMPEEQASTGILDALRRVFVPDAIAQSAPALFSSITVQVSGPDLIPIVRSFSQFGEISMTVPAGSLRRFEVTANVANVSLSAARSFRGVSIVGLPPGATVSLPVVMSVYETKLVIPDLSNNRLYIMNSILDPTPVILETDALSNKVQPTPSWWTDLSLPDPWFFNATQEPITPFDIDFDARGRIYFNSNYMSYTEDRIVFRIDNINGDGLVPVATSPGTDILSLAIDRKRNILYFGTYNNIMAVDLATHAQDPVPIAGNLPGISNMRGMMVDDDTGYLYVACNGDSTYGVAKINPRDPEDLTGNIFAPLPGNPQFDESFDVQIKWPFGYVTQFYSTSGSFQGVRQFRLSDMTYTGVSLSGVILPMPDSFNRPKRFIGKLNRGFIVMDDTNLFDTPDRLVGFLTMDGLAWYSYEGDGFQFYEIP